MPHECTTCGRTFADGSKEMLSGCPDCGGNKFQYHPGNVSDGPSDDGSVSDGPSDGATSPVDGTATDQSTDSSFEFGSPPADATTEPEGVDPSTVDEPPDGETAREDRAQTSARKAVVSEEELTLSNSEDASTSSPDGPSASENEDADAGAPTPDSEGPETPDSGSADSPDSETSDSPELSELREELNEQFESIKIHDRGEYELNLMELYDREEHIIALQEDGRYVIDVPSSWREDDDSE